ncbi:MAG: family 43 glycosylhydrolase, partial [Verrucomicrobiae bacterium]|nr:family 43 glycosylhydrolase [Verrucomicrobiae bacterium]
DDFKSWTYRVLNWPTKAACTSPTSKTAMVWAPSVVKGPDGKFHMFVSVGNEVWTGVADAPLGPWRNPLGDKPLIPENFKPGFHMIDAEAFIDDDGQAYLYWGSGWEWVNGRCFVVKLKPDMVTFDGEVRDVTPANYFEAPFMVKHDGRYFLMYSSGRTDQETYKVHYATGDTPFGPFTEGPNSPILVTDKDANVVSTGHHAVMERDGKYFILYHRHSIPFDPNFIGRQVCIDELRFGADGTIEKVVPTHEGPDFVHRKVAGNLARHANVTASGQANGFTGPGCVTDDNYATRWAAPEGSADAWLKIDLGEEKDVSRIEIRPEYAWKAYRFTLEGSDDGESWSVLKDHSKDSASGSPIVIEASTRARFLRVVFVGADPVPSIFEWVVF